MIGHISFCKSRHEICQHTKEGVVTWAFHPEQPRLEKRGRKKEKKREKSASQGRRCVSFAPVFVERLFVCWHIWL